MLSSNSLERNLQISGIILIFGLVVEALCLLGRGPISFLVFTGLGGLTFALGIAYYLLALVRSGSGGA
jgi:hypothetical protein